MKNWVKLMLNNTENGWKYLTSIMNTIAEHKTAPLKPYHQSLPFHRSPGV